MQAKGDVMTEGERVTPAGSPFLTHDPGRAASGEPTFDEALERAIDAHFAAHFELCDDVFHEHVSDLVHIDVHWTSPRSSQEPRVLFTSGMSYRPMKLPDAAPFPELAELMIVLPSSWPVDVAAFEDERNYWPVRLLKTLARLPHQYETWLGPGHTIANGEPPGPFAPGTQLSGSLLLRPVHALPEERWDVHVEDGRTIGLLAVYPLYRAELELKTSQGTNALLDALDAAGVGGVVDPVRPSAVAAPPAEEPKKKRFGLF